MMPLIWRPGTPYGGDLSGISSTTMWDAAYACWDRLLCPPGTAGIRSAHDRSVRSQWQRRWRAQRHAGLCCRSWIATSWRRSTTAVALNRCCPDELLPSSAARQGERAGPPVPHRDVPGWRRRSRGACDRCACRRCGPALRHPCRTPPQSAACRFSRWRKSGRTCLTSTVSLSSRQWGTFINDELRPPYSAEPSYQRLARDGRGGSRRQPNPAGDLGTAEAGPHRRRPLRSILDTVSIKSPLYRWFPPTTANCSWSVRCRFRPPSEPKSLACRVTDIQGGDADALGRTGWSTTSSNTSRQWESTTFSVWTAPTLRTCTTRRIFIPGSPRCWPSTSSPPPRWPTGTAVAASAWA